MKWKTILSSVLMTAVIAGSITVPLTASAQSQQDKASKHRQKTKNDWRNLSYGAGAVGVLGLLKHDNTMTIVGVAGTLYSLDRYEHDRKSQSHIDHSRSAYYHRTSYMHNGHRYVRKIVTKNGKRYYQFVRG